MDNCNNQPKICIIGAGFSGICAGIKLQQQLNLDSFTIFDENHDVGGTWLVNQYPGCACDVPSHLYSLSFEPNPYWSKAYSGQHEIWEYLRDVSRKHDLYSKIKLNHQVKSLVWDEKIDKWHVTVVDKENGQESRHVFDIVVSGVGAIRSANYPKEFSPFSGKTIHSAEWDSSVELKDKVVAIVGSGASAVQLIPAIADKVKRLIVYQRKAAWVSKRNNTEFPTALKWAFAYIPGLQWAFRALTFWSYDLTHSAFKPNTFLHNAATKERMQFLADNIHDDDLRKKVTPDYAFGCKRMTPSSLYYPALQRPNVTVINSKITKVTSDSIENEDGTIEKPEILILATGFKVQDFFAPMTVTAKGGEDLLKKWKKNRPSAYAGILTSDTPNMFFLLGPNTALGHNSVVFSIECQVNFMIDTLKEMQSKGARTVTIKKSAEEDYMDRIDKSTKATVWGSVQCGSWYVDDRGVNTTLWPESLVSYHNLTKSVDTSLFDFA